MSEPYHFFLSILTENMRNPLPAIINMFKGAIETLEERCEICSKLIKTPERRQWRRYGVFIINFEHISHFFLVFLL